MLKLIVTLVGLILLTVVAGTEKTVALRAAELATAESDRSPLQVAISSDGLWGYTTNRTANSVSKIDLISGQVVAEYLGAQWDNLPGPDEFLSYDASHSRDLATAHNKTILDSYTDPLQATETRCMECHSLTKVLARRETPEGWRVIVAKMRDKRKDWIKAEEVDLIANYLAGITAEAGLLRHWKICGPFENAHGEALRSVLGPEQTLDFSAQ